MLTFHGRSGKHRKIWWNEKFRFSLSSAECRKVAKVTLRIMERDKFSEDSFVGEIRYRTSSAKP